MNSELTREWRTWHNRSVYESGGRPYLGDDTEWAFAIWQASSDSYADAVLLDGQRTGHPSQALDTACTLYLASTGDQPAEPLKDLRGAALVI